MTPTRTRVNYCLDCDWSASIKDYTPQELSKLAIEHSVETGHDIDSILNEESDETANKSAQPTDSHVPSDTGPADSAVDD